MTTPRHNHVTRDIKPPGQCPGCDAYQSFTCPRCRRTSYNPNDVREGYCGACHDWTRK